MTGLVVSELSVSFGGATVLDGATFEIGPSTIHALIGPNGAGKTTCINAITGYVKPRHGVVSVNGTVVTGVGPAVVARRGIARTFQHPELFGTLTPAQHIRACRPRRDDSGWAKDLAGDLIGRLPDVPASGLDLMGSRLVEIARAVRMGPIVLLLDEPVAGLDSSERQRMATIMRAIAAEGVAILLIEHDMEFVRTVAQAITVLDSGRVVAQGAPEALFADEYVVRAYMGGLGAPA
jgi:ABC-type branched-subunit amino acid transport system ATPase component